MINDSFTKASFVQYFMIRQMQSIPISFHRTTSALGTESLRCAERGDTNNGVGHVTFRLWKLGQATRLLPAAWLNSQCFIGLYFLIRTWCMRLNQWHSHDSGMGMHCLVEPAPTISSSSSFSLYLMPLLISHHLNDHIPSSGNLHATYNHTDPILDW